MTFDEYLAREHRSPIKHEFVRGEVYAMSGATRRHDRIVMNLLVRLGIAARGGPCVVNSADVKVQPAPGVVYYPDVSVDCVPHRDDDVIVDQPCLVVEVTSRSTARVDRGEKLDNYRRAESLRMYLIVDHRRRRVTCHRRDGSGPWVFEEVTDAERVSVPCPRTDPTLDAIYEGIDMSPLGVAEAAVDDDISGY